MCFPVFTIQESTQETFWTSECEKGTSRTHNLIACGGFYLKIVRNRINELEIYKLFSQYIQVDTWRNSQK
jgi:hypothetical protein